MDGVDKGHYRAREFLYILERVRFAKTPININDSHLHLYMR
jgi:hypothetical protein